MARGRKFRRAGGAKKSAENANPEVVVKELKPGKKGGDKGKKFLGIRKKVTFNKGGAGEQVSEFAGLIFMCNTETKKDCFKYNVFGYPEEKKDLVERAKKGMKLFLFDIDQKVLHGIYKASSLGGMNIVSEAFQGSERKFPAQIRFRIQKVCAPLDESAFKPVIKENYYGRNKFRCELSSEQVGKLMQLFRPLDAHGLPKPKPMKDSQLKPTKKGNARQESTFKRGNASGGPRTRAPHGNSRSSKLRGPPAGHYSRTLAREPLPLFPQSHSGLPGQGLAGPDMSRLDADVLYGQRIDSLDRRAYLLDPLMDASLRQVGVPTEFGRRRLPEDLYVAERSLPPPRGALLYEDVYREVPYQREALYSSLGNLPYRPLSTLPWGYP